MNTPIYQVDSFTSVPFRGNPAGVCILASQQPDEWMRSVATEMNLSETAFLLKEEDAYRLRWFTPRVEVSLCGHATLAAAHVLWESNREPRTKQLTFHTVRGILKASYRDGWIELDFPAHTLSEANPPDGLLKALGVEAVGVRQYSNSYLVEVENEAQLRSMAPDMDKLERVQTRSVAVTTRSENPQYDFISRYFAPKVGVPEDPVTGSAHCALTPFWAEKLGKTSLMAFQASARGGELRVQTAGERVILAGQAVTVIEGLLKTADVGHPIPQPPMG